MNIIKKNTFLFSNLHNLNESKWSLPAPPCLHLPIIDQQCLPFLRAETTMILRKFASIALGPHFASTVACGPLVNMTRPSSSGMVQPKYMGRIQLCLSLLA